MRPKILVLHWFGHIFDGLQWVGQIYPSRALYVILEAWGGEATWNCDINLQLCSNKVEVFTYILNQTPNKSHK